MIGLEWLRRKAAEAIGNVGALGEPVDRDVQRVAPLVETALRRREQKAAPTETAAAERIAVSAAVLGGVTVAEASAAVAAVSTGMRRGDPLVACGCWPRYLTRCRCPDNGSRLPH